MQNKTGLLLIFFLLFFSKVYCQPDSFLRESDSLYNALQQKQDAEEKAYDLFQLSFLWSYYDTIKGFRYIEEAKLVLNDKAKQNYYKGLVAYYSGSNYFGRNNEKAKALYMNANQLFKGIEGAKKKKALYYRSRAWNGYASLLQHEDNDSLYMKLLVKKVIPLAKQSGDTLLLGNGYSNVAMNLMNQLQYDKADEYYQIAINLLKDREDGLSERFDLYLQTARNAMFNKQLERAREMLDEAEKILKKIPYSTNVPYYHSVAGTYYAKINDLKNAQKHFAKGIEIATELKDENLISTIHFDEYQAYRANGNYKEAKRALLLVVPFIEKQGHLSNKQMVYYHLAGVSENLGEFSEALKWFKDYMVITDSLYAGDSRGRILELEKKFKISEKEKELLRVKAENQEQSLKLQKMQIVALSALLLLIVFLIIAFAWYKKQQNKKKRAQQKQQILQQELKAQKQQAKINLYNAMLEGEERERGRLSRDLHDGLGGMLANVKMKLSAVTDTIESKKSTDEPVQNLRTTIGQLDQSVNELRRIARNLMPDSLLNRGLEDALRDLCKGMMQPDMAIDFQSSALSREYPHPFMIAVYRIVQELLTNAIKHSEANQVWVQCMEDEDLLYISVEDNGKGFHPATLNFTGKTGMGLANIRNRVELLNGHLTIDAGIGKGASFHIQLPKREEYDFSNNN